MSIAIDTAATMTQPARTGSPKSIWSAIAPPRTSAMAVATVARYALPSIARPTRRGRWRVVASARHMPVAMPKCAALCCSTMSIIVDSVTIHSSA